MTATVLEALLRRDRMIVGVSVAALTMIAWAYILWLAEAVNMDDMAMQGMDAASLDAMVTSELRPLPLSQFFVMFSMWAVMMVGMMTPSAAPMILLYTRVGRQSEKQGKPLAATGFFLGGYLLAWTAFAIAASLGQWALESALLLTPMMASASGIFSGVLLIAVGSFQ
jgi:predicted metal-binding membrane protein